MTFLTMHCVINFINFSFISVLICWIRDRLRIKKGLVSRLGIINKVLLLIVSKILDDVLTNLRVGVDVKQRDAEVNIENRPLLA